MTEDKKPAPVMVDRPKYCEGSCRHWDHRTSWCERLERRVTHGELCELAILARLKGLEMALDDERAYHERYTAVNWRVRTSGADPEWYAAVANGPILEGESKESALRALWAAGRADGSEN